MELRAAHEILRAKRKKIGLSIKSLADRTALSKDRISDLEQGRRPIRKTEWHKLVQALNLNAFLDYAPIVRPTRAGDWSVSPPKVRNSCSRNLRKRFWAAKKRYPVLIPTLMRKLSTCSNHRLKMQFLREAQLDSSVECLFWLQLLHHESSLPKWLSPLKCGFRSLAIVDPIEKTYCGDARFPSLEIGSVQVRALLFTQVTVQTRIGAFRLDALVKIQNANRSLWLDLEIDGPGHRNQFDIDREIAIALPTLRIQEEELTRPDFGKVLAEKFNSLFGD